MLLVRLACLALTSRAPARGGARIAQFASLKTTSTAMRAHSGDSSWRVHPGQEKSELAGEPASPTLPSGSALLRYFYEGGKLSRDSRLVMLPVCSDSDTLVDGAAMILAMSKDGVDFDRFYPCVYEAAESGGSWVPLQPSYTGSTILEFGRKSVSPNDERPRQRIDVKLFRRIDQTGTAIRSPPPSGDLVNDGYFGIGICGAKTPQNIGSLWRSAFQLGASFIFTVGGRYAKTEATDTLVAHKRLPCFEHDDWSNFVEHGAPKGAVWVGVEFNGEPLETFQHPKQAVYILGSEDTGLPSSVASACHAVRAACMQRTQPHLDYS